MTISEQWTAFLSGYWMREPPTKPGYYPVEGIACGEPAGCVPSKLVIVYGQLPPPKGRGLKERDATSDQQDQTID